MCVCDCLCVGRLEGGMGDRDVKEERWPESRRDEQTEGQEPQHLDMDDLKIQKWRKMWRNLSSKH